MNKNDFQEYMGKVWIHFCDAENYNLGVSMINILDRYYPEYKRALDKEKRYVFISPYYDERNVSIFLKWLIDTFIDYDKLMEFIVVEKDSSNFGDVVAICSNIKNAEEIVARINSHQRFIYRVKKNEYCINQRVRI